MAELEIMAELEQVPNSNPLLMPIDTRIGPLHLRVTSVERALPIWRDMVGLHVIEQSADKLVLGIDQTPLIILEANATQPVKPKSLGLYHVAIHVPTRKELARAIARQIKAGIRTAPTDHLVSEATYLWDLDGNGIEMTFETPERGIIDHTADPMRMITSDGRPHSGLEPINLDDLFSELDPTDDLAAPLPAGTRIGHVHVHVKDLKQSMGFYANVIGFQQQILSHHYGMGDVKTHYEPHILAFNIWSGPQAEQPDPSHAGLTRFELIVPTDTDLIALKQRLDADAVTYQTGERHIDLADPSGNQFRVSIAA